MEENNIIKIKLSKILILVILAIIVMIGYSAYKANWGNEQISKITENKVDQYLGDIYYGTDTWMPTFNNINSTDENWIWECAYSNLFKDGRDPGMFVTKEQIENSAKEVFGENLKKQFPNEGLEFWLEPEADGYFVARASIEADYYIDYIINSIENKENKVVVEIIEYRYNDIWHEQSELQVFNINYNEPITKYDLTYTGSIDLYNDYLLEKMKKAETFVVDNKEKFSTAKITLEIDEKTGNLYIVSVER